MIDTSDGITTSIRLHSGLFPENTRPSPSPLPLYPHALLPRTFFHLCSTQGSQPLKSGKPARILLGAACAASEMLQHSWHIRSWHVQKEHSKYRLWRKKAHVRISSPPRVIDKNQLLPKSQFLHLYNGYDNSTGLAHMSAQLKCSHIIIAATWARPPTCLPAGAEDLSWAVLGDQPTNRKPVQDWTRQPVTAPSFPPSPGPSSTNPSTSASGGLM